MRNLKMKNNCEYYDQMLGTENLEKLVYDSSNCVGEDKTIADELIVSAEEHSLERNAAVPKTGLAKELRFKKAYAMPAKYTKEAVGIIKQWTFKWAAYPTLGCTDGKTKEGIEDLVGKEYFDAKEAAGMNIWANCVTYPLIAFGVYNWVCPMDNFCPMGDYLTAFVSGVGLNLIETMIRVGNYDTEKQLFKNPTLIGALISTPVKE